MCVDVDVDLDVDVDVCVCTCLIKFVVQVWEVTSSHTCVTSSYTYLIKFVVQVWEGANNLLVQPRYLACLHLRGLGTWFRHRV